MAANDKEVLVKADHVKVYFKGKKRGQTVKAVDDVSFEIMKGETFGVVGESGCGKSTLGRTLIRLQQPTDGHIYLNGTDIAGLKGAQLKEMRNEVPSPYDPPSGCHFHTRCPKACDKCRQTAPELKEVAPGHYVACHLYE